MRKYLIGLLAAATLGTAAAQAPFDGEFIIIVDGVVVGTGEFEDGQLELDLLAGFTGSAQLLVISDEGEPTSLNVMVGEGGSIYLDSLENLADLASEVEINFETEVDQDYLEDEAERLAEIEEEAAEAAAEAAEEEEERLAEEAEEAAERAEDEAERQAEAEEEAADVDAEVEVEVDDEDEDEDAEDADEDDDADDNEVEVDVEVEVDEGDED